MRKFFCVFIFMVLAFGNVSGQWNPGPAADVWASAPVSDMRSGFCEVELGFGVAYSPSRGNFKYHPEREMVGFQVFAETRFNLPSSEFDVGLRYEKRSSFADYESGYEENELNAYLVAGDYYFRRTKAVNPFVGLCAGAAGVERKFYRDNPYGPDRSGDFTTVMVTARTGIEFYRHFRLTLHFDYFDRLDNQFGATFGVVFGGGNKKK